MSDVTMLKSSGAIGSSPAVTNQLDVFRFKLVLEHALLLVGLIGIVVGDGKERIFS